MTVLGSNWLLCGCVCIQLDVYSLDSRKKNRNFLLHFPSQTNSLAGAVVYTCVHNYGACILILTLPTYTNESSKTADAFSSAPL